MHLLLNFPVNPNSIAFFDHENVKNFELKPEQKLSIGPNTPFEEEYTYTDADGVTLVSVRKYFERDTSNKIVRDSTGKPKKQFRQFINGRQGVPEPRPLYNIPNILEAGKVMVVHGERELRHRRRVD